MKIRSFIKLCAKIYKTKAAKVALLGVCSTMLLVSSGVSFAKYYSENGFGEGAGPAKFFGDINYTQEFMEQPESLTKLGKYGFVASFSVIFESEVSFNYTLKLRLSPPNCNDFDYSYSDYPDYKYSSFILTDDTEPTIYTFKNKDAVPITVNELAGGSSTKEIVTYEKNKFYYAHSEDGTNYTWEESNNISNGVVTLDSNKIIEGNIYYYKIIFFVQTSNKVIDGKNSTILENSQILYDLRMIQEGGQDD